MKLFFVLLLTILVSVFAISEYDDPRVNPMGGGYDILTSQFKDSLFVLESLNRSDPDIGILTKTLPKYVVMTNDFTSDITYGADIWKTNSRVSDSRKVNVNAHAGYGPIKSSFGIESTIVKTMVSNIGHYVTRVLATVTLSDLTLQTSMATLSPDVIFRVTQLANLLEKGTNVSIRIANNLADSFIRTYGTHVISRMKLGGTLSKIDSIDMSKFTTDTDQSLKSGASVSFSNYFGASVKIQTEHSDNNMYYNSISETYVKIYGGLWKDNSTFNDWQNTLSAKPAVVEIFLTYILDLFTAENFPTITFESIAAVRNLIEQRNNLYYEHNTYIGCGDPKDKGYVQYTNVVNNSMCGKQETYDFGGLFTTGSFPQTNILTNEYSCPDGFDAKFLITTSFNDGKQICGKIFGHQFCIPHFTTFTSTTYICIAKSNATSDTGSSGMYFGGMYAANIANDVTQDKSCPEKYIPFVIRNDYSGTYNIYICIAPFDVNVNFVVPFGGLFSYQSNNYLVGNKPVCGAGFERHLVGSEFSYCVGLGSLNNKNRDVLTPGHNSIYTTAEDMFVLYTFKNGSHVGIELNPMSNMSYTQQLLAIYKKTGNNYIYDWLKQGGYINSRVNIAAAITIPVVLVMLSMISITIVIIFRYRKNSEYGHIN